MTPKAQTIRAALDLYTTPTTARRARQQPLPVETHFLLLLATGDDPTLTEAHLLSGRDPAMLQQAAAFFVEQVLLEAGRDSYRMLGVQPTDPIPKIRQHMALLMRWLHPDLDPAGQRALLAPRVIRAWDDVKTPERRRAYDAKRLRDEASAQWNPEHRGSASQGRSRRQIRGHPLGPHAARAQAPGWLFDRRSRWGFSSLLPRPIFVALCRLFYR